MKRTAPIIALVSILLLALASAGESRLIRVAWEYQDSSNIEGFRLYVDNRPLCETTEPGATTMDCTLDLPDGETRFTLTAFSADGQESEHSPPYASILSSSLRALFTATPLAGNSPLPVTFDASGSTGTIVRYDWMFGDGESGSGRSVAHTFANPGSYTVTLQVTDDLGATDQETAIVTVSQPPKGKKAPKAVMSASATVGNSPLLVRFDGTASVDPDGLVVSYRWDMGDGGRAAGSQADYTYTSAGTYTATLTVTDDTGLTDTVSTPVIVSAPPPGGSNKKPVAVIGLARNRGRPPFSVLLHGQGSFDPDGKITKYTWNFGDGGNGSGPTVNHTYSVPGRYVITLQVTDNRGAISELAQLSITVVDDSAPLLPSLPFILNLLLNGSGGA